MIITHNGTTVHYFPICYQTFHKHSLIFFLSLHHFYEAVSGSFLLRTVSPFFVTDIPPKLLYNIYDICIFISWVEKVYAIQKVSCAGVFLFFKAIDCTFHFHSLTSNYFFAHLSFSSFINIFSWQPVLSYLIHSSACLYSYSRFILIF